MIDLDLPWWSVVLACLYVLAPWIALGVVAGGALAYLPLLAFARRGGRAPEGKLVRVGLSLLAAFAGDVVEPAEPTIRPVTGELSCFTNLPTL